MIEEHSWSPQPRPESARYCFCFRASKPNLIFLAIMSILSIVLLVVFYSQIVGATRQYLGDLGTFVSIPRAPQTALLAGNATSEIQWLRWERYERWMYTWEQAPIVKLCGASSNVLPMLLVYLAVGSSPDSPSVLPMHLMQSNCTMYPVRIAADNCDPASLFIGVNSSVPLGEPMAWSMRASYELMTDCKGGLGAATFYATVALLSALSLIFAVTFCVGLRAYCGRASNRDYELVSTTDMIEIREY